MTTPTPTETWWVAPVVIAAIVTAVVAILGHFVTGWRARRDRHRQWLAEAFADVIAYQEYAFIVRRRRADEAPAERARISNELSEVQQRLRRKAALLRIEAPGVAAAYFTLVAETKRVAGAAIRAGWDAAPVAEDGHMHITDVDLSALAPYEDAYSTVAADHLAVLPAWARRAARNLTGRFGSRSRRRRMAGAAASESI